MAKACAFAEMEKRVALGTTPLEIEQRLRGFMREHELGKSSC